MSVRGERGVIDRGYGWVVVVCAFVLQGAACGISFSVGVFFVEWLDNFEQTHDVTAWVGSLNTGLMFAGGPVASALINRFGHRAVAFSGCLLCSLGLVLASYATALWQLFIAYGLIAGIGVSMMFIPGAVVCGVYFEKYRAVALGIATSGVGMFCLVVPPLLRLAVEHYGWRGAMIWMSALSIQTSVFAYLLFPVQFWMPERRKIMHTQMQTNIKNTANKMALYSEKTEIVVEKRNVVTKITAYLKSLLDADLLCDIKFHIFFINNSMWNCGSLIILVMVTDYAITSGISKNKGAILLSIIGLTGLVGRVTSGILANFTSGKPFIIFNVATLLAGVAIGLIPVLNTFAGFCAMCGLYGLCFGAQVGVLAVTTLDLFGLDKLSTAYGYIMLSHGLGALSGPPLAGLLYEVTNGYSVPFYFGGLISITAAILACFIPIISRLQAKGSKQYLQRVMTDIEIVGGS